MNEMNMLHNIEATIANLVKKIIIAIALVTVLIIFVISGLSKNLWSTVGLITITQIVLIITVLVSDKYVADKNKIMHNYLIVIMINAISIFLTYKQVGNYFTGFAALFLPSLVSVLALNKYINIYVSAIGALPFLWVFTICNDEKILVYKEMLIGVFAIYVMYICLCYLVNKMYIKNVNYAVENNNITISKNNELAKMIEVVKESSMSVNEAANGLAIQNQELSITSQEQAASIQETSAAVEELISTVKQNTDNTVQANKMSTETLKIVSKGNEVVEDTILAMEDVANSSVKILGIINVVNDIAFQTNLLALNAAVEAARAGEQGKGFAVVASEVRNLAGRTANASKEIQALIGDSVKKTENGNLLVQKTSQILHDVTQSINSVYEIISQISNASQEQYTGLEQVSIAITKMDEAIQKNTLTSENAALLSQSMKNEAEQLFKVIK